MQKDSLRRSLAFLRDRLNGIKDEQESLRRKVGDLESELVAIERRCHEVVNQIFPISELPHEILGAIFTNSASPNLTVAGLKIEVVLSHVSRRWRDVAIRTPHIWKNVTVSPQNPSHREMLELYLERSGALPFNIKLSTYGKNNITPDAYAFITPLAEVIARSALRLCRFYVEWSLPQIYLHELLEILRPLSAPLLQDLCIIGHSPAETEEGGRAHRLFSGGVPSLRSLTLKRSSFISCTPVVTSVTKLQLYEHAIFSNSLISSFCHTLSALPLLEHLELSAGFVVPDNTIFELPSLTHLGLRPVVDGELPSFMRSTIAPKLKKLVFEAIMAYDLDFLAATAQGVYQGVSSLTVAQSYGHSFSLSTWNVIVNAFPNVEEFIFSFCDDTHDFITILKEEKGISSTFAWPKLRSLTVSDKILRADDGSSSTLPLGELIAARYQAGLAIKQLFITQRLWEELDSSEATKLNLGGVHISLRDLYASSQHIVDWHPVE